MPKRENGHSRTLPPAAGGFSSEQKIKTVQKTKAHRVPCRQTCTGSTRLKQAAQSGQQYWVAQSHRGCGRPAGNQSACFLYRTTDHLEQRTVSEGLRLCRSRGRPPTHSRVAGADAETAHQHFGCFLQHVSRLASPFLYQLLVCLMGHVNIHFAFSPDLLMTKSQNSYEQKWL